MAKVALVKGEVRYDNLVRALELVRGDLEDAVSKSYRPVIVPDALYPKNEFTVTHLDALRALIDFITQFTNKQITVAGSSFSMADIFSDFHYFRLQDSYSLKFIELSKDDFVRLGNAGLDISKTLKDSDCRISLGMLHTHNVLLANLSLSQFVLNAVEFNQRKKLMLDPKLAHLSISAVSKKLLPHFAVIDGFSGIQGDFPLSNNMVGEVGVAIASRDCFAQDSVAASLMGIPVSHIAYLRRAFKKSSLSIVGEKLSECRKRFQLPSNHKNLVTL